MAIFGFVTAKEHKRQIEALKAEFLKDLPKYLLETAEAFRWSMPDPSIYGNQADLYRKLSWVLQAVDMTATAASLSKFSVKRVIEGREPKDIPNHPFELLLMRPNPLDSRMEFLYGSVAMFLLTGNVYWYLNKEDEFAPPQELWVIPSHMIQPVPDGSMYLKGYMYYPGNGREILLEPWQICHIRRFNPFNPFVGLSAIESIALTAQGDLGMQDWNTRLFKENNARLPGILVFEQMIADPTWDKIKDDTREAAKKRELLMLRGTGQGGVTWLQNAVSQKEMEFLKGREFNRDEIWNTLAPGLVSMLSASATEANARNGAAVFNERSVYPKHVLIAEKINSQILPLYPSYYRNSNTLVGEFDDVRIADRQMEMDEQRLYAETHVISEIREEYYGDDPLGDERDNLLLAQIKSSGGMQEEPEEETEDEPEQEMESAENEPPEEPEEEEKAAQKMALLDDLRKWERKAIGRVGHAVEFTSDLIPAELQKVILQSLPTARSVTAVKAVFDMARSKAQPVKSEARIILQGLTAVLDNMEKWTK